MGGVAMLHQYGGDALSTLLRWDGELAETVETFRTALARAGLVPLSRWGSGAG